MKVLRKSRITILLICIIFTCIPFRIEVEAAETIKATSIITANKTSDATVTIRWKKVNAASGYEVYRKTGKNNYKKIATLKGKSKTSYVDKKTADNKTYYYAIKVYKGNIQSKFSNRKKVSTGKATIKNFNSSAASIVEGSSNVIFTAEMNNPTRVKKKSLKLMNGTKTVGYMHDDGKSGDIKANDGIFTYKANIKGVAGEKNKYSANYKGKTSSIASLSVFKMPTAEDIVEVNKVDRSFNTLKTAEKVYIEAQKLKDSGDIIKLSQTGKCVTMQFDSGIWYQFIERYDNQKAGGKSLSLYTVQPYFSDGGGTQEMKGNKTYDTLAGDIQSLYGTSPYIEYNDSEVTRRVVEDMKSNSVYLWDGHGSYDKECGPGVCLGECYNDQQVSEEDYVDLVEGTVFYTTGGRYAITYRFFDKYVGYLDNTFMFLGTCYGAKGDLLCGALKNHGITVIGYSDSVNVTYDENLIKALIGEMLTVDEDTQSYTTVSDALDQAKKIVGTSDKYGTYPRLFGDGNYRFSEESFATISMKNIYNEIYEGKTVDVSVESNIADKLLVWESSNPAVATITGSGSTVTVKGIKEGETTITCKAGDKKASCKIIVKSDIKTLGKDDLTKEGYQINYWATNGKIKIKDGYLYIYDAAITRYEGNYSKVVTYYKAGKYRIKLAKGYTIRYEYPEYTSDEDRYTFYTKTDFNKWAERSFSGLGLEIQVKNGKVSIIQLYS